MTLSEIEISILNELFSRKSELASIRDSIIKAFLEIVDCYNKNGTLFTCGNGGSFADAIHIAGELMKSFERKRPLDESLVEKLSKEFEGSVLVKYLESGLRAVPLGLNPSLKTAIENDIPLKDIAFAQELNVLIRPGDVLLAISTSGNAKNCLYAMSVAKAKSGRTIAFTGPNGGQMAQYADVAIRVPGDSTKIIQEYHQSVWHTLCAMIEVHFFPEKR